MKQKKLILSLIIVCAVSFCSSAEAGEDESDGMVSSEVVSDSGFDRYQSIIDRQPFGPPPPGFDPSLPASQAAANGGAAAADGERTEEEISAEEQKMMSSVRVSVLNVTPSGATMVGFTDSTTQPPVNYYLKVGDTSTDSAKWTVKSADPGAGTVTLAKDGIDVTLAVGDETKKGAPAGKKSAPESARKRPSVAAADDVRVQGDEHGAKGALGRLRMRRAQRHAEEQAQKRAAEKERAEAEAKEREAQEIERERAAEEREQQREALLQIQEELRRHREAKAAQKAAEEQEEPLEE